jgi:hypothetical protein
MTKEGYDTGGGGRAVKAVTTTGMSAGGHFPGSSERCLGALSGACVAERLCSCTKAIYEK